MSKTLFLVVPGCAPVRNLKGFLLEAVRQMSDSPDKFSSTSRNLSDILCSGHVKCANPLRKLSDICLVAVNFCLIYRKIYWSRLQVIHSFQRLCLLMLGVFRTG